MLRSSDVNKWSSNRECSACSGIFAIYCVLGCGYLRTRWLEWEFLVRNRSNIHNEWLLVQALKHSPSPRPYYTTLLFFHNSWRRSTCHKVTNATFRLESFCAQNKKMFWLPLRTPAKTPRIAFKAKTKHSRVIKRSWNEKFPDESNLSNKVTTSDVFPPPTLDALPSRKNPFPLFHRKFYLQDFSPCSSRQAQRKKHIERGDRRKKGWNIHLCTRVIIDDLFPFRSQRRVHNLSKYSAAVHDTRCPEYLHLLPNAFRQSDKALQHGDP